MINAAMPAMCGLDIEVPDSASYRLPLSATGETAAMTSTPGAVMSGFSRSPPPARAGPFDENAAIAGASTFTWVAADRLAVAPAPADAMYERIVARATWSTWIVGTKWKSALSEFGDVFMRIMPTPPPFFTARLLSVRAFVPRSQATIFPAILAGSSAGWMPGVDGSASLKHNRA